MHGQEVRGRSDQDPHKEARSGFGNGLPVSDDVNGKDRHNHNCNAREDGTDSRGLIPPGVLMNLSLGGRGDGHDASPSLVGDGEGRRRRACVVLPKRSDRNKSDKFDPVAGATMAT